MSLLRSSYRYGLPYHPSEKQLQRRRVFLIGGKHIARSLSPAVNASLFESAGADWRFDCCISVDAQEFQEASMQPDFVGAAITMPNKVAFMPLFDILTMETIAIGAVSCAFVRLDENGQRKRVGTNTDWTAIRDTLGKNHPTIAGAARGRPALVIGAGGAARAAVYALHESFGASPIYLVNRLKSEVDDLIEGFGLTLPAANLQHVATVEEARLLSMPQMAIGNVPDVPASSPEEKIAWQVCKTFLQCASGERVFLEMAYDPPKTRLVSVAKQQGWHILEGREVITRAAAANQSLWLEREHTEEAVKKGMQVLGASVKL